jgi:hypothetical protein
MADTAVSTGPFDGAIASVRQAQSGAHPRIRARCDEAARLDWADLVAIRDRVALEHASGRLATEAALQLQAIAGQFASASLAERVVFITATATILAGGR